VTALFKIHKTTASLHDKINEEAKETLFQIAIAISAISIVISKRFLWVIAMITSVAALVFFVNGIFLA